MPIQLTIDHQCPQCGAPATLEETDRLFTCGFCRVSSFLQERGHFRYLLPSKAPQEKELVYVPYWRFKGLLFTCLEKEIRHRFVDISQCAVEGNLFPPSVGVRSQALKLKFVTPKSAGTFLKPTLPFETMLDIVERRCSGRISDPVLHRAHIGDNVSIIYSPFYIEKKLFDAVLDKPVGAELPEAFTLADLPEWRQRKGLNFLATLCPHCGWDLSGQRDSLVLNCENCTSVWRPLKHGFSKLNAAHLPEKGDDVIYLPFWRIKGDMSGLDLHSFADLVRLANLPRAVQAKMETTPFYFWSLAFKVRPRNLLQLSRGVTLAQPGENLVPGVPKAPLHPVTLPLKEGVESLKLTLMDLIRPKSRVPELAPGLRIDPKRYLLVYLPFHQRHHDLVQPLFNLSVNRNMLAHARNI